MSRTHHRKPTVISKRATGAMTVTSSEVQLHAGFTAAVKAAYLSGDVSALPLDQVVSAVEAALADYKGRTPLPTWNTAAVDAALSYLAEKRQITLPSPELVGAS
ncbi:MAG TPA: hypothetical protein VJM46_00810 [Candidatus Saccharimonadales bacterium]|nr:hypothetical protein [Candidatus Saccharimonadales bacterium]